MLAYFLSKYISRSLRPLFVDQSNNRHFWWRERPDGWSPRPAPPAHIEQGIIGKRDQTGIMWIKYLNDIIEREYLPFMRMP